jgi:hypothetical protein
VERLTIVTGRATRTASLPSAQTDMETGPHPPASSAGAEKIQLSKDKETYLATLYGKAMDAGVEHPILGDRFAAEAVARIDYDFKALKLPKGGEITLAMRAWHFDQWTREFLAANPASMVLHLGCGLDTRVYRVDPGARGAVGRRAAGETIIRGATAIGGSGAR